MATLTELKCPYCGKPLSPDEYDCALEEFQMKAREEYKEQAEKDRSNRRKNERAMKRKFELNEKDKKFQKLQKWTTRF